MSSKSILDRLHARAQGRLTPGEEEALERELAADPTLAALADDYRLVHALTAIEPAGAGSRTSYEELERHLARPSVARRVAAAAGIVLLVGAAFLAGRSSRRAAEPLYLDAIDLDAPLAAELAPVEVPTTWASYDPRGPDGVRFLGDLAEATTLARVASRPLLVYGSYPECPMAAALDAKVFSDARVVELLERTVPVHLDLSRLTAAEQRSLNVRGYPFLEIWFDDGSTAHSLVRNPDPVRFVESLHDGLEQSHATGPQPAWADVQSSAARLGAARAAELEGRLALAERGFRELASGAHEFEEIAACAAAGLARLSQSARELLFEARAAARSDLDAALRLLARGIERFAGTSFEEDLRAALERLERDGAFPHLAEADRSA